MAADRRVTETGPAPARHRPPGGLGRLPAIVTERRLRLGSGLVLFAFVAMHLVNHALGLVSVAAMEAGRFWFELVWDGPVQGVLFYGSLGVHFVLSLRALHRRRTLRMPLREALQIALGIALPVLLVPHVLATTFAMETTGHATDYPNVVHVLWSADLNVLRQSVALVVAWMHGCLGLWFWLRPRSFFPRIAQPLFAAALLVPVLSLLGFAAAGKEIASGAYPIVRHPVTAEGARLLSDAGSEAYAAIFGALLVTLLSRTLVRRRGLQGGIRITYPDGRTVAAPPGSSVLEASRMGEIPHVSVCGGKGRCSTCRVRIVEGLAGLSPAGTAERATLDRIGAPSDVRLACQLRPTGDLRVAPIVEPLARLAGSAGMPARSPGAERDVVVLFCDLRGFTAMSENRLPFDTVFLLNRFFAAIGEAVESSDGYIDKFIGDGALAIFGLGKPQDEACADALHAAARISRAVDALGRALADDVGAARLRVAMGMHTGPAIVGRMGYGRASDLTVVGDTINTASRLETVAKENDAELVLSVELATRGGLSLKTGRREILPIRGRSRPLDVLIVVKAGRLDESLAVPA